LAGGACWLAALWPAGAETRTLAQTPPERRRALAYALGQLHRTVKPWPAFLPSGPGAYWSRILQERLSEIVLYRSIVRRRGCRTDIEGLFMENFESSYDRGQEAVNSLAFIDQKELASRSKSWSFWGLSPQEIFWREDQPLFYSIWPSPGMDMLDLGLLLKSLLCQEKKGETAGAFRRLWEAYSEARGQVTETEKQFFRVMWRFPEGYWYHARRYFLRQGLGEGPEAEQAFYQWEVSILKERRLLKALEGL
jgi:hypothetical protein